MSRRDDEPGPSTRLPPQTPAPEEDVAVTTPSSARRRTPTRKGKERMYACDEPDCGKMFSKPAKLIEHSRSHTGERPYVCPTCSAAYLRSSHLTAHQRTHLNPEDKEYQCAVDGCGKTFWTEQHLRRHEKGHDVALVYQVSSSPPPPFAVLVYVAPFFQPTDRSTPSSAQAVPSLSPNITNSAHTSPLSTLHLAPNHSNVLTPAANGASRRTKN